jgi:hypothetical protein
MNMWLIIVCCVEILYDVKKTREDFKVYAIQPYGLNPTEKSQSATFSHSLNFIRPYNWQGHYAISYVCGEVIAKIYLVLCSSGDNYYTLNCIDFI